MKKVLRGIFAALFVFITTVSPVFAIANPDSIAMTSKRVYQNVFESGDMLFIAYHDVAYASLPDDDADVAFLFNLYGTDGTTLLYSRGIEYYNENVISIYLNATQASALTWGTAYIVKITGNPAMFASIIEGTNMVTQALSPSEWISGTSATTPDFIYAYLYNVMEAMQVALSPTDILVNTSEGDVLNATGSTYFTDGIPGINSVIPQLFQTSVSTIDVDDVVTTGDLATELTITTQLGAQLASAFTSMGSWLGISTAMAGGLFISGVCLFAMYLVFLYSGSTVAAMILAIPFLLIGTWSGLIPLAIMYTVAILVVAYMGYHLWLRGV